MIAGIEEMENLDSSETHPRRLNANEVLMPQRRGKTFRFQTADGTAKLFGRDHGVREPTPRREQLVRSEDLREELQGISERSQPTEATDDAEVRKDFRSIEGDFIYRHHIGPRVQLYVPKEETIPISLKHIDVTRATYTKSGCVARKPY